VLFYFSLLEAILRDVAEISEAVGENVGVFVARGDGPSNKISREVMRGEGWFLEKRKDKILDRILSRSNLGSITMIRKG